jgi:hypothetical protein
MTEYSWRIARQVLIPSSHKNAHSIIERQVDEKSGNALEIDEKGQSSPKTSFGFRYYMHVC